MIVTLPGAVTAFGFFYGDNSDGLSQDFAVNLSNGGAFDLGFSDGYPDLNFWGIIDPTPFSSLTVNIGPQAVAPVFDNVSWSEAVTPEPGSLSLLALGLTGLGGIGASRRRRFRKASRSPGTTPADGSECGPAA